MSATSSPHPDESLDPLAMAESSADIAEAHERVAGATGILALGNISSRVLGLAREKTLAFLFGPSAALDAFRVAVIVPQTFYDLLIGGHVGGAIVPVLSEIFTLEGRDELWKVVNILLSLLVIVASGVVLGIQLFAPLLVRLTAGGYDPATQALAVSLLRLTSVGLLFLALFAILSSTLYAMNRFTLPAFAGVVFNGTIVVVTFALVQASYHDADLTTQMLQRSSQDWRVIAAGFGWLFGALAQMVLQLPGVRLTRIHLRIHWQHPAIRRILGLYAPVMFSLLLDIIVIRVFSYNLASQTGIDGGISYMGWATTLIQFPQGMVATAISIAILPTLSAQAAKAVADFRATLGLGIRLATTLIIPATIGLWVLATPVIQLLFEGGAFMADDTAFTAVALRLYLLGLPFAAIDLLLVYAFYARQDTLTPAIIGMISHLVYVLTVLLLFEHASLFSLMIADSIKHFVHAAISAWLLRRRLGGFGEQRLILTTVKALVAASSMGIIAMILLHIMPASISDLPGIGSLLSLGLIAAISGSAYLGIALLLRTQELLWLIGLLRKRINH